MKKTAWIAIALSALLVVGFAGCGGDDSTGDDTGGEVDPGAWAYPETKMVVNALYLPESSATAKEYAFDLDHNGTVDNQLGNILAALKSSMGETSPQVSVDEAMDKGDIIVLFSVFAQDMAESAAANLWAFLGEAQAMTNGPQAGDAFTVDSTGPTTAYFGGKIKGAGGVFGGDNATLTLNLPLTSGSSLELSLQAVNMEFDIQNCTTGGACEFLNGKLGGAITESDLNDKVLPEVTKLLQDQIAGKCALDTSSPPVCVCEAGSGAETIESMFDTDQNCDVTLAEVQNNNIIKAFLKGDVTLKDGTKALSLAVGFDAVNATYDHIAPPQ